MTGTRGPLEDIGYGYRRRGPGLGAARMGMRLATRAARAGRRRRRG